MPRGGAVWSARMAHNHQVAGSNPAPATKKKRQPFGRRFFFVLAGLEPATFCEAKIVAWSRNERSKRKRVSIFFCERAEEALADNPAPATRAKFKPATTARQAGGSQVSPRRWRDSSACLQNEQANFAALRCAKSCILLVMV